MSDRPEDAALRAAATPLAWRLLWLTLGILATGLGLAGVVLPVLPTTPFMIVAAACFFRSSPRLYTWVLTRPAIGPLVAEWRATRTVPRRAKRFAIALIALSVGSSAAFVVPLLSVKLLLVAIGLSVIVWLWRLPSRD